MKEYFKRLAADPKDGCDFAVQFFAIVGTALVAAEIAYFTVRTIVWAI